MMNNTEKKVRDYADAHGMIAPGDLVLAGVSGGGDSIAMLAILKKLCQESGCDLKVVHINHGIRGKEADRDQHFVEKICREWEIPCTVHAYDVPSLCKEWGAGHEETGRRVRREAFEIEKEKYGQNTGCVRIALAHNQGDLAETLLHNLARGSGIRGLASMRPVSGEVIRPVLCLDREEITAYLEENEIPFVQDSTNFSDAYTRNRIRRQILPMIEENINTQAVRHMAETAGMLAEAEDYLTGEGEKLRRSCIEKENSRLMPDAFFAHPPILQMYALQQMVEELAGRRKDITAVHLRSILGLYEKNTGAEVSLPYGLRAKRKYEGVLLEKRDSADKKERPVLADEQKLQIPGMTKSGFGTIRARIFSYEGQKIEENQYTKWLDYDKINCTPSVRTRRQGDYLIADSRGSRKKLTRVMIDGKIPREERENIPLIACGDEILWMVGYRMNERYKITSLTARVLELEYQGGLQNE